ncbi:MAG: hypothetical protein ABIH03_11685 [Pseudomonadota bacterium]
MRWLQNTIGRPQQAHGVGSPDAYRRRAKAFLLKHGVPPILIERGEHPMAYVSDGRWVCDCDCGNGPSVSPEWEMAICLECGSVYVPTMPADYERAETVLLKRPSPKFRHWFPDARVALRKGIGRAETLADLRDQNRLAGVEVD